jgi:hypothetical protein
MNYRVWFVLGIFVAFSSALEEAYNMMLVFSVFISIPPSILGKWSKKLIQHFDV